MSPERGMFTGNRGCLVDDSRRIVRRHAGNLWITCVTEFRDWKHPLDAPHRWTPLFFLDDAVALADGTVILGAAREARVLLGGWTLRFAFGGWSSPLDRSTSGSVDVLTPPLSVGALRHGFEPTMHATATIVSSRFDVGERR